MIGWGLGKTFHSFISNKKGLPVASGRYLRFKCSHCSSCYIVFYKDRNGIYSYSEQWSVLEHFQLKGNQEVCQDFAKGWTFFENDINNGDSNGVSSSIKNKQEILASLLHTNDDAFNYTKCHYFSIDTNHIYDTSDCYGIFNPPVAILAKIKTFSELVQNKVNGHCIERRNMSTNSIIQTLLTKGIQTSENKVKKASMLINKQKLEEHLESIHYIIPWLEVMNEKNPSFHFQVDKEKVEDCNMLQRINIVFPYTKELVESQYMIKLLGIDGAHVKDIVMQSCELIEKNQSSSTNELKKYTFEGMRILLLTSKTCFNNMVILAMSLCFTEDTNEYIRLIQTCKDAGVNLDNPSLTVISDRSKSIVSAIEQSLPEVYHAFCPLHLERNLISKGWKKHLLLYYRARKASTHSEYSQCMNCIRDVSLEMYKYLANIDHWQMHVLYERSLQYGNTLYEVGSDNLVESPFSWLLTARKLSPFYMIKNIVTNILIHQQRCEEKVSKCNDTISPYAALTFSKRFNHLNNNLQVIWGKRSCNGSATVQLLGTAQINIINQFQVNLQDRRCSCFVWQQTGIPCKHAIACMKELQTSLTTFRYGDYFYPMCSVECAKNMYKDIPSLTKAILPNDDEVYSLYDLNVGEEGNIFDLHDKYSLNIATKQLKSGDELTRNRKLSRGEEGKRLNAYKKNGIKLPCPACGKKIINLYKHGIGTTQVCYKFAINNQDKVTSAKTFWNLPENKILLQFNNWGLSEENVAKLLTDQPFFNCKEALPLLMLNNTVKEQEYRGDKIDPTRSNKNNSKKRVLVSPTSSETLLDEYSSPSSSSSDDDKESPKLDLTSILNSPSSSSIINNPYEAISATVDNAKLILSKLAGKTLSLVGLDDSDCDD